MSAPWIRLARTENDGRIESSYLLPVEAPWFEGHFPQNPILPGIALMHLLQDSLNESELTSTRIKRLSRVRFRQIIHPGEKLEVFVKKSSSDPEQCRFSIDGNNGRVCDGSVVISLVSVCDE